MAVYIIMYSVYSYVHSLPLIITLNICEILRNNWIHLLKEKYNASGFHKNISQICIFQRINAPNWKKINLKSAQVLLLLNKLRTNIAKFEKKSQISWSWENHKWFTPIFQWKFLEHLAFFKLDTVYHSPDIKLLITSLLLNALFN